MIEGRKSAITIENAKLAVGILLTTSTKMALVGDGGYVSIKKIWI